MRGPLLIACAAFFAVAAIAIPKPAQAQPGTPVVTYGDTGVVERVGKRYNNNRYSRNWNKGRHYRPYAYNYRPYGYGYRNYGYRGYGYNRPYYGRNYGYYGRPGVNLWFGF